MAVRASAGPWIRLHPRRTAPVSFSIAGANRFDAAGGGFGILYAAVDVRAAFLEMFGSPDRTRVVSARDLAARWVSVLTTRRPLRLVDLTNEKRLRAVDLLAPLTGRAQAPTKRLSAYLWAHEPRVDGVLYRMRHDRALRAVAIFERAQAAIRVRRPYRLIADDRRLAAILDRYGFALVD